MDAAVLVVGAGPAGLAVAACLRRRGVRARVVDRGAGIGERWASRYTRLRLHTPRVQSGLPGLPIPRRSGRWVARDDLVAYLRAYARAHVVVPEFGVEVRQIAREGRAWRVETDRGDLRALQVVVATGDSNVPFVPAWPGRDTFRGRLLHAADYRDAGAHAGDRVLVVGAGNSGAEIATDLAEGGARAVWLSVRTGPNVVPRSMAGVPTTLLGVVQDALPSWLADPLNRRLQAWFVGDLRPYGLPPPCAGVVAQFRRTGTIPIIDVGLVAALRAGQVEPVPAVTRFAGGEVVLSDGRRLRPDTVVAATGYGTGLRSLVGHLGVLDARARPLVHGAATRPGAPGLRFVGVRSPLKGLLLQINLDARAAARAIARDPSVARVAQA